MKTSITSFLLFGKIHAFIAFLFIYCCCMIKPVQSSAQQDSLHLFSVTYIKLKDPTYAKQYEDLLNYYSRKIAEYGVKSGKINGFVALKVLLQGSTSDYDYEVVVNSNSINTLLDDTAFNLKNAIPGITDEIVKSITEQYNDLRTIVKREIYAALDMIPFTNPPKYLEVDFMKPAAGKVSDYVKAEKETWKPVHKERIKLGGLSGWELDQKVLPAGDKEDYDFVTANFYDSLPMMMDAKYEQAFKTIWPKMDINKVGSDVGILRTMVKSDLLKPLFAVDANTIKQQ